MFRIMQGQCQHVCLNYMKHEDIYIDLSQITPIYPYCIQQNSLFLLLKHLSPV